MKKTDEAITRATLDEQIDAWEIEAREQRQRLLGEQQRTNLLDEKLRVLRLARAYLFPSEAKNCCP